MIAVAAAIISGLLLGSFLNVCIYRWPRDLSIVFPARSFCPSCQQTIAWYDNLPIVSFGLLKARCRTCSAPISIRYPLVEMLTSTLFGFGVWALGPTLAALKFCLLAAMLIVLFFSDLEERILPDEVTLGGTLAGIVLAGFVAMPLGLADLLAPPEWNWRWVSILESVLGTFLLSGALWAIGELYFRIRKREGLGFGDVKMMAALGSFLGVQGALLTLAAGSILGTISGLLYIFASEKDAATYELPFGSFLAVAGILVAALLYPVAALFPDISVLP